MKSSLQRELNSFFKKLHNADYGIHAVTKGALTQARAKLKPEAFLELNQTSVREFYRGAPYQVWKKHRLLAVDGSTLNLPVHESVRQEFGEHGVGCHAAVMRSMARTSVCYDVLNLLAPDARIDRFTVSEQTLLKAHLQIVNFLPDDVLLPDRGYPSIALMYTLQQRGIQFCMRMKNDWWKAVQAFQVQEGQSREIILRLPQKDQHLKQQYQSGTDLVKCRLVRIEHSNGEHEVLCTSLLDPVEYTIEDLHELYHLRWNVEEAYKLLKTSMGLEAFSGKTANAVRQDFYAEIFMMTICAAWSFPIEKKVREQATQSKRKHPRKINRINVFSFAKDGWIALWAKKKYRHFCKAIDDLLIKTTEIVRPNRHFKRKHRHRKPPPMNIKQSNP